MFNLLRTSKRSQARLGFLKTAHGAVRIFSVEEPLALQLATLNNVEFYLKLMSQIRQAIKASKL